MFKEFHSSKKFSYVSGLILTDKHDSFKNMLAEYQPNIVNRYLVFLMTTTKWTIRATDPITVISELDLKIIAPVLQSNERMADTVKRCLLLKELAPFVEAQKHVMMNSERLKDERMKFEDVDGACVSGSKGTGKMKNKGKSKTDNPTGKAKAKDKGKKGGETRVCHECNCVFAFREAVIAVVLRPETPICIDSGALRSS